MLKQLLRRASRAYTCEHCGTFNRGILIALLVAAMAIVYHARHWQQADWQKRGAIPGFSLEDDTRKGKTLPVEGLPVRPANEDEPRIIEEEGSFSLSLVYLTELIAGEIRKQGKDKVMVFDFHDQDGEATPFGFRLTHEVSKSLAGQPDLQVVRVSAAIGDPFDGIDAAVELGLSLGADVVCVGRVYDPADMTRIELQVIDVNSKKTLIEAGMPVEKEEEPGTIQRL